jgi:hypothetical protein
VSAEKVLARGELLPVQRREPDVRVFEAHDPLLPEVFFVAVPADAVKPDAQEQANRQHRQRGVAPQLHEVDDRLPVAIMRQPTIGPRGGPGREQSVDQLPAMVHHKPRSANRSQPDNAHATTQRRKDGSQRIRSHNSYSLGPRSDTQRRALAGLNSSLPLFSSVPAPLFQDSAGTVSWGACGLRTNFEQKATKATKSGSRTGIADETTDGDGSVVSTTLVVSQPDRGRGDSSIPRASFVRTQAGTAV